MSKISSVVVSGILSRRSYGIYARAAANGVHVSGAGVMGRPDDVAAGDAAGRATSSNKDTSFWMRDPKTGCWVPENRFQEVDAVELRNRLIHRHK
ncbi:hypothetical protein U9M48_007628 [Paspalum notatum var. saurae]|uniref:Uncharacterized protein n=1 Tax=Paspalum notatum var. saurae TaxID=547442 RepID=A0AAQ3SMM5_PASNO